MSVITNKGWIGHFIALIAGLLTPLFLAPFNIWPLAFVSVGCFYLGLQQINVKQAFIRSWLFGAGAYLAGVSWIYVSIHDFGNASALLAAILTIVFCLLVAFFFVIPAIIWVKWFRVNQCYFIDAFAFAGLWAVQEWFRGWFLTGFPWLYTGYSQLDAPLAGFAPIGGVWLVSFLIALISVLLIKVVVDFRQHKAKVMVSCLVIVALFIAGPLFNKIQWTTPIDKALPVTLIQGNISQEQKWDSNFYSHQLNTYWRLTLQNQQSNSLVIWPENAIPFLKNNIQSLLDKDMSDFERNHQSTLITGLPIMQKNKYGEDRYYNGITVVGNGQGDYLKQKLVPFGEYVPLQDILRGLITFFNLPMSDFSRGEANQSLLTVRNYKVAPFICYEVVYPDFVASFGADSNLLVTISNDTWFGHSIGPKQHLQMAQMRALESGRWMARATNNGITVIIDNKGKIVKEIPSFKEGVLQGEVTLVTGKTPYQCWQSYFILLLSTVFLSLALFIKRYKKERN